MQMKAFIQRLKQYHDDVIKWKHFPRYWPFVRGIHRSPVNSPHKGQWRGALMFSLIYVWINDWVNNREAGDLRRYRAHYDIMVMIYLSHKPKKWNQVSGGGSWSINSMKFAGHLPNKFQSWCKCIWHIPIALRQKDSYQKNHTAGVLHKRQTENFVQSNHNNFTIFLNLILEINCKTCLTQMHIKQL